MSYRLRRIQTIIFWVIAGIGIINVIEITTEAQRKGSLFESAFYFVFSAVLTTALCLAVGAIVHWALRAIDGASRAIEPSRLRPPKPQAQVPEEKKPRSLTELRQFYERTEPRNFLRLPLDVLLDDRFLEMLDVTYLRVMDEYDDVPGNVCRKIEEGVYRHAERDPQVKKRLELRYMVPDNLNPAFRGPSVIPKKKQVRRHDW